MINGLLWFFTGLFILKLLFVFLVVNLIPELRVLNKMGKVKYNYNLIDLFGVLTTIGLVVRYW